MIQDKTNFQHILRLMNTNIDGRQKVMYALTSIKGCGRRYAQLVCRKADIDMNKRFDFYNFFHFKKKKTKNYQEF